MASSQDWPPLQNNIQFWEEHYLITTRKLYIQAPSIHCYFWESISWYIPNGKGLYRKIQQCNEGRQNSCFAILSYFKHLEKLSHRVLWSKWHGIISGITSTNPEEDFEQLTKSLLFLQMVRRFADPNQNSSSIDTITDWHNIKEPPNSFQEYSLY